MIDTGAIFMLVGIGGVLWCAWMIGGDAPRSCGVLAWTVQACLDWQPPKGIHADISVCRCGEVRVAFTSGGDEFAASSDPMIVHISPRDSWGTIHDKLDVAANEFLDPDNADDEDDFERSLNLRGEWN